MAFSLLCHGGLHRRSAVRAAVLFSTEARTSGDRLNRAAMDPHRSEGATVTGEGLDAARGARERPCSALAGVLVPRSSLQGVEGIGDSGRKPYKWNFKFWELVFAILHSTETVSIWEDY